MPKDMSKYGLIMNPFPSGGYFPLDSEYESTYAKIIVGKRDVVEKIQNFITDFLNESTVPVIFIVGDYGFGKTHLLKHIQYAVQEAAKNIFPVYIKNIGEPRIIRLYKAVLDGIYARLGLDFLASAAKNISKKAKKIEMIKRIFPDIAKIIPKISSKDHNAIRWLFGEKIGNDAMRSIGVIREITDENAVDALIALIRLIYYGKNYRLLILVDELESIIGGVDNDELRRFYEGIRTIIDKTLKEAQFVFTAPPAIITGKDSISFLHPALYSRLFRSVIELKELDESSAKILIREYLAKFRKPNMQTVLDPLYPFTEDAIATIYKETRGVPRRLLQLANVVLEEADKRNLREINAVFVDRLIKGSIEEKQEVEDETKKIIKEVIEERKIEEEVEKLQDLKPLQKEIIKVLKKNNNSLALGELSRKIGLPYGDTKKTVFKMQSLGILSIIRRGPGYRVFLSIT